MADKKTYRDLSPYFFNQALKKLYLKTVYRKRDRKNQSEIAEEAIEEYLDKHEDL